MTEEEMLTPTQAAEELGYSRTFVYTLIHRGDLKVELDRNKRTRSIRIPRSSIEAIKRNRQRT
jgi:excisionase family DNA binding protein